VVPEHEIVLDFDNTLLILSVILLDKKKQFCFNCRLIIIFLLILNEFHSDHLLCLVIETFQDLTECTLADLFNNLEAEPYLVILRDPIVTIGIIVAVINDPLSLCGMNFEFIGS
jgi:hypothetical protein